MAFTMRILDRDDVLAAGPGKTCDNCLGGCAGASGLCSCDGCMSNCNPTIRDSSEPDAGPLSPLED